MKKILLVGVNFAQIGKPPEHNTELLARHTPLLKAVWAQMLNEIDAHVDRVMIAVQGGEVLVPGIYPEHTDIGSNLPFYQP